MAATMEMRFQIDINAPLVMQEAATMMVEGDNLANTLVVEVMDGDEAAELTGCTATAYMIRADGHKPFASGTVKGNIVRATLNETFYAAPGRYHLFVRLTHTDGTKRTLIWLNGYVNTEGHGALIDPDTVIPSLDDLLAQIEAMERVTEEASAAAQKALEAAAMIESSVAAPIINSVGGRGIMHAWDASNGLVQGLRIYGRTTVNNPTPQASATPVGPGYKGSVVVTVTGKNLFDKNNVEFAVGLINASGVVDASITYYVHTETYIPVRPNTAYVFSGTIVGNDRSNSVAFYGENKQFISRYASGVAGQNSQFVTPAGCYYIRFNASADYYDPATIQLEANTVATAYAPYSAQVASMATGSLHGVKVPSGGNYTDENGQMWLADYIDSINGRRVSNIPGITYTGSNYAPVAANSAGTAWQMALPTAGYPIAYGTDQAGMVFSNRLPTISRERVISGEQGIAINNTHAIICVDGITTLEGIKAWLAAEPLSVYYRPAAPMGTVVNMTTQEAAAFKALHSNFPHTTVYNDVDAWMAMTYIADTKRYIDNRIAALAAASI